MTRGEEELGTPGAALHQLSPVMLGMRVSGLQMGRLRLRAAGTRGHNG